MQPRAATDGSTLQAHLRSVIVRDLGGIKRELAAYPDEASIWREIPGLPNTGGTLALHLAGNLQHFFGAILGQTGYVRTRDAEFARRGVPRAELVAGLDAAIAAVQRTLDGLDDAALGSAYPEPIAKRTVSTELFLLHLTAHLAYHLGQMDYHRRAVTGQTNGVDAVSVRELPERA